jgi:NADH:ubiquinone oxidoreductase subunit 4 (subunit M)
VVLAIIGILYGALVAMVQPNMKKLVAYSSVSHLGFVVLGIFTFTQMGLDGAVYQMLNHGISTGALFVFVGLLYERRHSLEIDDYGGVATAAPWLSTAFLVTTLASIGLPMLNNFVGEFLVLQGAAIANFKWAVWAAIGVIFSACYMLWMYQRVFYGEVKEKCGRTCRPQPARMGGGDPAHRDDGVDGRLLAIVPAAGEQDHRARAGADAGERAGSGANRASAADARR